MIRRVVEAPGIEPSRLEGREGGWSEKTATLPTGTESRRPPREPFSVRSAPVGAQFGAQPLGTWEHAEVLLHVGVTGAAPPRGSTRHACASGERADEGREEDDVVVLREIAGVLRLPPKVTAFTTYVREHAPRLL